MFIKPVKQNDKISDFENGDYLPVEGREVHNYIEYWEGLIEDGIIELLIK